MKKSKKIILQNFFSQSRKTTSTKNALKDVISLSRDYALKDRKENKNHIIKLIKHKNIINNLL